MSALTQAVNLARAVVKLLKSISKVGMASVSETSLEVEIALYGALRLGEDVGYRAVR